MDKEHVVTIYKRVLDSAIKKKKKNEWNNAIWAAWIDLEITKWSTSDRERQILIYDITYK